MKGSDISSPPCHPACPERSRRERSSPIFSSAPHLGVSGCVVEGPWQHPNLNQAPRASNQFDLGRPRSALLRSLGGRSFKFTLRVEGFTLRIEGPRRKPPQNNPSPNPYLRPNPRTGDFNRHERLFPLFTSRASEARFCVPRASLGWRDRGNT